MPGERLILNPITESSSNAPLELVGPDGSTDWGLLLINHEYPAPARAPQYAGSADTEGDPLASNRYANREITITLRAAEPSQAASTNLVTNPRAAIDTTGWTNNSLVAMERRLLDQTSRPVGIQGAETALYASANADADSAYATVAVTSGQSYSFSAWVYLDSNTATGVKLTARNAGATLKASSSNLTTTGSWTKLSLTVTADSTANWRFGIEQVGAGAAVWYSSLHLVENSGTVGPYFDGDTPGCDWSGTAHASTSTRAATGGSRFYAILDDLQTTIDKIVREGGTLKRVPPGGKPMVFDLLDAQIDIPSDNAFLHSRRAVVTIVFTAKPFWRRGEWTTLSDNTETTNPYMSFTYTGIAGEVPAIGKLLIDEDQGQTQRWLAWGLESRNYSASANAGVFYEAEGRTLKGNAAIVTATGASGGASNNAIRDTDLVPTYQQILSTQATGAGDHLAHVGKWRVFARAQSTSTNTGTVQLRLEWGQGDFRRSTQNDPVTLVAAGNWELLDLGVVTLDTVTQGTQRWEGRVLAKSSVPGDEITVDYLWLCPATEVSGEITAKPEVSTSYSKIVGYDLFNQTAGSLSGKTANIGGNWSSTGDATDFAVVAGTTNAVQRSEISDVANTGRYAYLAGASFAGSSASIDIAISTQIYSTIERGVLLRYIDANNWLMASLDDNAVAGLSALRVRKRVAGTVSTLATSSLFSVSPNTNYTVSVSADASGNWVAAVKLGTSTLRSLSGTDSVLATAGTLASGYPGFYDEQTGANSVTRTYDNFVAEQTTSTDAKDDAAIFASQSAEIRYDSVVREDSTGTVWSAPGKYEGDLLIIPCAGRNNRSVRFTLKAARYGPGDGADSAFDDISAQLSYQPRGLTTPDPS